MKAQEEQDVQEKMGADLDPEQENADLDEEDAEEHPDYYHIDPDQVEDNPTEDVGTRRVFKAIALPSKLAQVILKSPVKVHNVELGLHKNKIAEMVHVLSSSP